MTFSTATIQGKVMWIGWKDKQGKQENRNTTTLWVNVPDKRSDKDDNGNHTKGTLYQVRVWDNQAITAQKYIEKFQTITITGSITGIDNYKENFILCDIHWNSNGHDVIAYNIINYLNSI